MYVYDYVLSFDIGTKNLSYCLLNKKGEIEKWDNIQIYGDDSLSKDLKCKALYLKLEREIYLYSQYRYIILIENQQGSKSFSNFSMIEIQNWILMYFTCKSIHDKIEKILIYSANNKLLYYKDSPYKDIIIEQKQYSTKYQMNKWMAEAQVNVILQKREKEYWIRFYMDKRKKSDLADSYLMGLHFILKNESLSL